MSVINKYPFIDELLSDLSSDELTTLTSCINGQGATPIFRTLKSWSSSVLSSADKGIYPINLEMNGPSALTYQGYLIYNDDWCVLIAYVNDDACQLTVIDITMPESGSDIKWSYIPEKLTINELRSEMFDVANGSGGGGSGGAEPIVIELETKLGQTETSLGSALEPTPDLEQLIEKLVPLFDVKQETINKIVEQGAEPETEVIDRIYLKTPTEIFLYVKPTYNFYFEGKQIEGSKYYASANVCVVSGVVSVNDEKLSTAVVTLTGAQPDDLHNIILRFALAYGPVSPTEKQLVLVNPIAAITYSGE